MKKSTKRNLKIVFIFLIISIVLLICFPPVLFNFVAGKKQIKITFVNKTNKKFFIDNTLVSDKNNKCQCWSEYGSVGPIKKLNGNLLYNKYIEPNSEYYDYHQDWISTINKYGSITYYLFYDSDLKSYTWQEMYNPPKYFKIYKLTIDDLQKLNWTIEIDGK